MSSILHKVMLIVALASASFGHLKGKLSDTELEKYSSEDITLYYQTPTNDGGNYERPNGHCYFNVHYTIAGCSCNPPQTLIYVVLQSLSNLRAVCGRGCTNATTCPDTQKSTKGCIMNTCVEICTTSKDCINGGICTETTAGPYCLYPA